jgi:hypothetical protein
VKPCCSRLDLYKEHAGIDLRDIFPADETKHDKAKIATWTWEMYLTAALRLRRRWPGERSGDGREGRVPGVVALKYSITARYP